ncbi:hypothetical protein TNCV_5107161 [Trichonephila clavipes]|uniref:Uncharacterized protein n=1 Tax=Trichonephila clavipes TaxID=2585209 RepID=A0A8X6RG93_TRICX|nr:hypothetical protein TNCV_5107161 [Trichonephila clavipes]
MVEVVNVTKGYGVDSPSRNDSPSSPINIPNKIKKCDEWVIVESETNFTEHEPGDISFKSSSAIVFRHGSYNQVTSIVFV